MSKKAYHNSVETPNEVPDFWGWWKKNKNIIFRYWVYRKVYTPYEQDQKFVDESQFEDSYASFGYIQEAVLLPDDDILLGFLYPDKEYPSIEYHKLSEIRLAYYPNDIYEFEDR